MDLGNEFEMLDKISSVVPEGWYNAKVDQIEQRVSASDNTYLNISFKIAEGDFANQMLWDRLNLWHPQKVTVEISQRRLSALFRAAGYSSLGNTDDLLGEEIQVRVKVRSGDNGYDDQNEIRDYRSAGLPMPPTGKPEVFGRKAA